MTTILDDHYTDEPLLCWCNAVRISGIWAHVDDRVPKGEAYIIPIRRVDMTEFEE